jgi:hypothetical protein
MFGIKPFWNLFCCWIPQFFTILLPQKPKPYEQLSIPIKSNVYKSFLASLRCWLTNQCARHVLKLDSRAHNNLSFNGIDGYHSRSTRLCFVFSCVVTPSFLAVDGFLEYIENSGSLIYIQGLFDLFANAIWSKPF